MRAPRFSRESLQSEYWNEVYRDCALIDAVREVAEELKYLREAIQAQQIISSRAPQPVSEGRLRELVSDKIRAAARLWYASEPDKDLRERLTEGLTGKLEQAILPALESA